MTYGGIQYYPISMVLFDEIYMELIEAKFGMKGIAIAMKLLCKIYKENGYYLQWGEEQCTLFTNKAGKDVNEEEMQGIVDILVEKGFFDKESYEKHQVLTSIEIQKVWLEATKRRKRGETASLPYILVKTEDEKGDRGDKGGKKRTVCKIHRIAYRMQPAQPKMQTIPDKAQSNWWIWKKIENSPL